MRKPHGILWRVSAGLSIVTWVVMVVGWIAAASVDIRTILTSGPAVEGLGLATLLVSLAARARGFWLVAVGQAFLPVLVFAMIFVGRMMPNEARLPVLAVAGVFIVLTAVWIARSLRLPAPPLEEWRCRGCGYALMGLPERRCPECGQPFDAEQAEAARVVSGAQAGDSVLEGEAGK